MSKEQPIVKSEISGGQYPKGRHHDLSGMIIGVGPFHNHQLTGSVLCTDLEQIQRYIKMDTLKGKYQYHHYKRHDY